MIASLNNPWVLAIGGHDPTGGAGIQADMETAISFGCRPATIVTCLTCQDTQNVHGIEARDPTNVITEIDCLLEDFGSPDAIKTGLIGSARLITALAERLSLIDAPLVVDPVLAAGGGTDLANDELLDRMREELIPLASVCTPNQQELRRLTGDHGDLKEQATMLLEPGCRNLFVSGADSGGDPIENHLFSRDGHHEIFESRRLTPPAGGNFHGTGCTLASAITARLARGAIVRDAVAAAQDYMQRTLSKATAPGRGQSLPQRLFWIEEPGS